MRLIDVDKVNPSDILIFADGPMTQEQFNCAVKSLLYGQPTIDPESLREHGQWIMQQDNTGVCSNCHRQDHIDPLAKYCRYCEARMCEED